MIVYDSSLINDSLLGARYAMIGNTLLATCYILVGTFDSLLTFIGMSFAAISGLSVTAHKFWPHLGITEYLFLFLSVLGIFILRRRQDGLKSHPYRTWTINPACFCVFSSYIVVRGVITNPFQGLAIVVLILIGSGIFRLFAR